MARYALVVGISEYDSIHLANLNKSKKGAEAIAALLESYGNCEKVNVLKGYVSTDRLETALTTLVTEQAIRNEVIIYFSGHGFLTQGLGGKKGYIATSDCEIEMVAGKPKRQSKAIAFSDLNNLIRDSELSNLVMLIDTCHSGELIERDLVEQSFTTFNNHQDYWVMTACRGFESAWAKKSEEHSIFTGALLDALRKENAGPSDFSITVDLLFHLVHQSLRLSRQEAVRSGRGRSLSIIRFPPTERPNQPLTSSVSKTSAIATRLSTVPSLPKHFVERLEQQRRVKEDLLRKGTKTDALVVSVVCGLGGIGKSVLAVKVAEDPDIQNHFPDGTLWVTLGQNPDILPRLSEWIQALGDHDYKLTSIESASNHLRTLLYSKRVLLVIDDVWSLEHLECFRVSGEGSRVLVTTRKTRVPSANHHELDVMSPEQSLELLTQKLSEPVRETNRPHALSYAKKVGYLPLSLELGASQVEEGMSWQELSKQFSAETVRLETLDALDPTEISSEERRRECRLLACFNLSLRQLSVEQLHQFAWLGILPEDVDITQVVVQTLWQVTSHQAEAVLQTFKSKALVLQGAKQANEQHSYRMHDLMHNLAQRLLVSPSQPRNEGDIPGLGMPIVKAHNELLERYQYKTQEGLWHTLKDDGYIYVYLSWHMEQAGQYQAIHRLLIESNQQGRNGWYEECEKVGKPAVFINDLGRAWSIAVKECQKGSRSGISKLFRYALIRTSLNSLVSKVPAELVGVLVKRSVWLPARGLTYAKQTQINWQKISTVSVVAPYLTESLLPEALDIINQVEDARYRSYALSKLAKWFPRVWHLVLTTVQQMEEPPKSERYRAGHLYFRDRHDALCDIAEYMPSKYVLEAIKIAYQIQRESDRSETLAVLAGHLPEVSFPKAMEMIRQTQDEYDKVRTIVLLASRLPEALLLKAIDIARQMHSKSCRSDALIALAQYFPDIYEEALETTNQNERFWDDPKRLIELSEHLPESLLAEALRITRLASLSVRCEILTKLAKRFSELWPEVLKVIFDIQDRFLSAPRYKKHFTDKDESSFFDTLVEVVEYLPEPLLPEIVRITHQLERNEHYSQVMIALAKRLPKLWPEALEAARQLENPLATSSALITIAQQRPDLWVEVLETICQIEKVSTYWHDREKDSRSERLIELAEYIPISLIPEILQVTRRIEDDRSLSFLLVKLVDYKPDLIQEALDVTRRIKDDRHRSHFRCQMLVELAERIPVLLPDAIDATRQVEDDSFRSSMLNKLVKHAPNLFPEALEVACRIRFESNRFHQLIELAKNFTERPTPEGFDTIRRLENDGYHSEVLVILVRHLPELWLELVSIMRRNRSASHSHYADVLIGLAEYIPSSALPKVLEVACCMKDETDRVHALAALAKYLPASLLTKALETARQVKNPSNRSYILSELAQYIPDLLSDALEAKHQTPNDSYYCSIKTWTNLASRSSSLWPEVLDMLSQTVTESTYYHFWELAPIIKEFPKEMLPELLNIANKQERPSLRTRFLAVLVQYFPQLLPEVLESGNQIRNRRSRASELRRILPYSEELSISLSQWVEILEVLSYLRSL